MSQFGMQMHGARAARSASADIYTVLAFVAFVAMVASASVMFVAAQKVGKPGSTLNVGLQDPKNIQLPAEPR
jgi:uncharacterized membrane protein